MAETTPREMWRQERERMAAAKEEGAALTARLRAEGCSLDELHRRLRAYWSRVYEDVEGLRARRKRLSNQINAEKQFRLRIERYGITLEEYDGMLARQRHSCACCGSRFVGKRRPTIDHDHRTGAVRGLLCTRCNTICGSAGDDPEELERAARYLRAEPSLSP